MSYALNLKGRGFEPDTRIRNGFSEIVWLKPHPTEKGVSVECCFDAEPCRWHNGIKAAELLQFQRDCFCRTVSYRLDQVKPGSIIDGLIKKARREMEKDGPL